MQVSIIIPAYNRSSLVSDSVFSAINQKFNDFEVIVVDDGSTDSTREILLPLINEGKITYIWQENKGRSIARNHGAQLAKGKYLLFLDSDDLLVPDALSNLNELVAANEKSELFMGRVGLFTDLQDVDYNNHFNPKLSFSNKQLTFEEYGLYYLSIGAFLVSKSAFEQVGGFNHRFDAAEDLEFGLKVLSNNLCTYSTEFAVVNKRRHHANTPDMKQFKAVQDVCLYYLDNLDQLNIAKRNQVKAVIYSKLVETQLFLKQRKEGMKSYFKMMYLNPLKALNPKNIFYYTKLYFS